MASSKLPSCASKMGICPAFRATRGARGARPVCRIFSRGSGRRRWQNRSHGPKLQIKLVTGGVVKSLSHPLPIRLQRRRNPIGGRFVCLVVTGTMASACAQGAGEGSVDSARLFVRNCWNGEFHLQPTFFAANPYSSTKWQFVFSEGMTTRRFPMA